MHVKYVIFIVFLFVVFQLSLIPLGNSAMNAEAAEDLDTLSSFGIVQEEQTFGIVKYVKAPLNYFEAFYRVMTSTEANPVFEGPFELIRWLIMAPLVAGVVFGLIVIFFGAFQRII